MKRMVWSALILTISSLAWGADRPQRTNGTLKVGDAAPEFTLNLLGDSKKQIQSKSLLGKPVVLIFGSCS